MGGRRGARWFAGGGSLGGGGRPTSVTHHGSPPHSGFVETATRSVSQVVVRSVREMVVKTFATEQRPPVDVELAVQLPRTVRPAWPFRVIDRARRVDANRVALTPNQFRQGDKLSVFPLHYHVRVINDDEPQPMPRR